MLAVALYLGLSRLSGGVRYVVMLDDDGPKRETIASRATLSLYPSGIVSRSRPSVIMIDEPAPEHRSGLEPF